MSELFDVPAELPAWDGRPRGPVTAREALTAHQRSWVAGLARRGTKSVGAPLVYPEQVPSSTDPRQMAAWRIDAQVLAYARARAAIEEVTLSDVVDRLLRAYAAAPPGEWPVMWAPDGPDGYQPPRLPGG